jgi:hypothetical protein
MHCHEWKGSGTYAEQLLERINNLIGFDVPEDVDDLAMPRLALGIHDVFERKGLQGMDHALSARGKSCLWVCDDLKPDMAGVGLAIDECGYSFLQRLSTEGAPIAAVEGDWHGRIPVAQPGECARHCRVCLGDDKAVW